MRKKAIVVLAATLLITAGLPRRLMIGGLTGIYEAVLVDNFEPDQAKKYDATEPEMEEDIGTDDAEADAAEEETAEDETAIGETDASASEEGASEDETVTGEAEASESEQGASEDETVTGEEKTSEAEEQTVEEEAAIGAAKASEAEEESIAEESGETESELESAEEGEGVTESSPEESEESAAEEFFTGFSALFSNETVVYDYTGLKNALANDNGITTVYFGDNITMQDGIDISSKKTNVIIDGVNPLDPGQSEPYTLTDYSSASFYDTIYIDSVGTKTLHVRNLNINGKNFFGPFSVLDSSALAGTVVTYERVDYNGPQMGYHRNGTIRFKNCAVRIHGGNGGSINQEFSEVKHLIFEGANTIDTATSDYSIFWLPLGGSFHIADEASLVLTSPNTSAVYGVFYTDGLAFKTDITIGSRASFDATISGVVAPEAYTTLNSLMIREGGSFYLRATKSTAAPILRMGGALTVERDAKFIISGYGSAAYALLRQDSGDITVGKDAIFQITADNAYTSLLNLIGRKFICNDPASVLLYNANRNIQASTSAGTVHVSAWQANYWNTLSPGGLDNPPLYRWQKADNNNFIIDGTLAVGASGNFSGISSNYTPGDSPGAAPNAVNFSMVNARVLAFGRLELTIADPTTKSKSISGVTAPGATVRVSFTQDDTDYTFPDVEADSDGVFHVPIDVNLNVSTVIKVRSNWQYLDAEAEAVVSGEGDLEFFVPGVLEFFNAELASSTKTVKRLNPGWKIVVSDTRGEGGEWSIYARLGGEMAPDSADRAALSGALVFVDDSGKKSVMGTDTETLISRHVTADDEEVVPVDWDNDKGVLLVVKPGTAFTDTAYTATILWTLVNGV